MTLVLLGDDVASASPFVRWDPRPKQDILRRRRSASILFVATGVALVMILLLWKRKSEIEMPGRSHGELVGMEAFDAACSTTFYPSVYVQTLLLNDHAHYANPEGLTRILISSASLGVARTMAAVLADRGVKRIGFSGELVCHSTLVSSLFRYSFFSRFSVSF